VLGRNAEIIGQNVHVNLNQLSSKQEKYVMLEVEISSGRDGEKRKLADVDVTYQDLRARKSGSLNDTVSIDFTKAKEEVKKSVNQPVMESAAEQVVNEMSKDAVKLRDEGKLEAAKQVFGKSQEFLKENFASGLIAPSGRMEELEQEIRQDADEMDDKDWNKKRKSMRARQFKMDNQQKY
jgi:Ca-activated chloride channel family protein